MTTNPNQDRAPMPMDTTPEIDKIDEFWATHGRSKTDQALDQMQAAVDELSAANAKHDALENIRKDPWANGQIAVGALILGAIVLAFISVAP